MTRVFALLCLSALATISAGAQDRPRPTLQPMALGARWTAPQEHVAAAADVVAADDSVVATAGGAHSLTVSPTRLVDRTVARAPWWAPVASVVVPGAGQFAMGQQRSLAYLVTEVFLVVQALAAQRDGNRARDEYRSVASDVARRPFGGARPVGNWEYYESMEKYLESGIFDRIPGGVVDPETDTTTFNGYNWRLARETFWSNPAAPPPSGSLEYQRAMEFYESRAVRDEYRWSWRDAQLQQDVYKQAITSANRGYQRAVNMLGLVGANHLTSLIDAYVTVRVRRYGGVQVAGLTLDRVETQVQSIGDPRFGQRQIVSGVRFVPASR